MMAIYSLYLRLFQLDDCSPGAALRLRCRIEFLYVRVGGQQIRDRAFENTHSVTVHDADAIDGCHRGAVEEFVDFLASLFGALSNYVDLAVGDIPLRTSGLEGDILGQPRAFWS